MKIFTHILTAATFLIIGLWYGYDKALMNQFYYDAPSKIILYNAVLEDGSADDFLKGSIIKELRNLEEGEAEISPILLNHPIHNGMLEIYKEYEPKIDTLPRVKEAKELMQTYNKKRNEMDSSVEPPIR